MSNHTEITKHRVPQEKVRTIPIGVELIRDHIKTPTNWDVKLLKLAEHISTWSKDPSTKCGAVIVDKNNMVISVGYNGLPRGIVDTHERLHNRELKYKMVCHCEMNAMSFARQNLTNHTLYTWPFMSCSRCAVMVIQSGIQRVVAPYSENERWIDDFILSCELFEETGIDICLIEELV